MDGRNLMRLRVLLTNGNRTVDLLWLEHNGTDVYWGCVKGPFKDSYHESGKRHTKYKDGQRRDSSEHHRLDDFSGQLQLDSYAFSTKMEDTDSATEYSGKKSDAREM